MTVIDYNGTGPWSAEAILRRYEEYARRFRVKQRRYLAPLCHEEKGNRWIYPVMDDIIEGIKDGDLACIALGVDSIGEDKCFPFGRILKSRTARALRQMGLPAQYHERVRNRIMQMLIASNVPRDYRAYAKLLRDVGLGSRWSVIEAQVDWQNPYVMRY